MRSKSNGAAPRIITIDGPGGVGKSTVAKLLADRLGVTYLDTGATYRALAYATLRQDLNAVTAVNEIAALARRLPLRLEPVKGGGLTVWLDGQNITQEIRRERVSEEAAFVSQHPKVREAMVKLQRNLATRRSVVVEGRDTGSVVFPHAQHKFFLTANPEVRARRRHQEIKKRYGMDASLAEVREKLEVRDRLDRTRKVGPLKKPRGAIAIDTSHRTAPEVVRVMLRHIAGPRRKPS